MTTQLFSILNTAKISLLAQQLAIEVTGQNISNVQTEGFSKQTAVLQATSPRSTGIGQVGTGVRVAGIERAHDRFLLSQIVSEMQNKGEFNVRKDVFDQVEVLFNDDLGKSLNSGLSEFFGSLHDLANNPAGMAERSAVVGKAKTLLDVFRNTGNGLIQKQTDLNTNVEDEVGEINSLLSEIARLNKTIHENEPVAGFNANDLRDKRDQAIKKLSEKIGVNITSESGGLLSLTLKSGRALVLDQMPLSLVTKINGNNHGYNDVYLKDNLGNTVNISSEIGGGKLRGILDMRDTELEGIIDKIDRLTAGFIQEVNRVHQKGIGFDGSTGVNFFSNLTPVASANTNNTGTGQISVSNVNPVGNSVDKYEILVTGANSFQLNNVTTGLASGTFTFSAGSPIILAGGLSVTLSGSAATGDKFKFSVSENASRLSAVNGTVTADIRKIAAGSTNASDGDNARQLAALQNSLVFDANSLKAGGSGTFTFDDFYNAVVGVVGVNAKASKTNVTQQEGILLQLNSRRESASGVSIDEEMVNLIKFQQAFNASARLITTVNDMLNTLQNRI